MFQPDKLADLISKPAQKADPFSLRSLVEWLEMQEGETAYDYTEPKYCLLGQYVVASGGKYIPDYTIDGHTLDAGGFSLHAERPDLYEVVSEHPWTFGAALQRARNLLSEGKE